MNLSRGAALPAEEDDEEEEDARRPPAEEITSSQQDANLVNSVDVSIAWYMTPMTPMHS